MIENESEEKILYYCKNCNASTQIEQVKELNSNQYIPICEYCGDKLLVKEKISNPPIFNREVSENLLYKNVFVDDIRFSKDFKGV